MHEFIAILVQLMMAMPSYYSDTESKEARRERITVIATSIDRSSSRATCQGEWDTEDCKPIWTGSKKDLALLQMTLAFWESRLAQHVHEGKCRPGHRGKDGRWRRGECDEEVHFDAHGNVRKRIFRARTIWQMQKHGYTAPEWDIMNGTSQESTDAAAWASAKTLSGGYNSCGRHVWGAISRYAGAATCRYSKLKPRVDFFRNLQKRYEVALRKYRDDNAPEETSLALNP